MKASVGVSSWGSRGYRNEGAGKVTAATIGESTTTSTMVPLTKDRESRECGSEDIYKGGPHRSLLGRFGVLLLNSVVQKL
jgi:hypothetical protein